MNKITKSFFIVLVMFFSVSAFAHSNNDEGVKGIYSPEGVNGISSNDEGVKG